MNRNENFNKTLKNLIIPIISFFSSVVLFLVFINPYNEYLAEFDNMRGELISTNKILENNLNVLQQATQNKDKLQKLDKDLISLIPDNANPSDLVGFIEKKATEFRFRSIDENRSVTSSENDKKKLIEVRFNGRSPGMYSSINFLKSLVLNNSKLVKVVKLELTNVPNELFTRVSFNALSIYSPNPNKLNIETPIENLFQDPNFVNLLKNY